MQKDTYDLLDQVLRDGTFKTPTEAVNYVIQEQKNKDFIEMADIAWMHSVANEQYKNGRTMKWF